MTSEYTGSAKEVTARAEVSQYAVEQLALINSHQVQDGLPPHKNLYEAACDTQQSGDKEHGAYLHELNKQHNQAKHDWKKDYSKKKKTVYSVSVFDAIAFLAYFHTQVRALKYI